MRRSSRVRSTFGVASAKSPLVYAVQYPQQVTKFRTFTKTPTPRGMGTAPPSAATLKRERRYLCVAPISFRRLFLVLRRILRRSSSVFGTADLHSTSELSLRRLTGYAGHVLTLTDKPSRFTYHVVR